MIKLPGRKKSKFKRHYIMHPLQSNYWQAWYKAYKLSATSEISIIQETVCTPPVTKKTATGNVIRRLQKGSHFRIRPFNILLLAIKEVVPSAIMQHVKWLIQSAMPFNTKPGYRLKGLFGNH